MEDKTLNINLNVNININIKVDNKDVYPSTSWALLSEDNLLLNLFNEIEIDKIERNNKGNHTVQYCVDLIDNLDVSFEPDPTYRDNVKYMIAGLVLCQILKQKTINLYRKGKEDREYLASYLMMKIQTYLINHHEVDEWDDIINKIYDHYKNKIRLNDDMTKLLENGINKIRVITQDILISTILSNKKNYKIRKTINPREYDY